MHFGLYVIVSLSRMHHFHYIMLLCIALLDCDVFYICELAPHASNFGKELNYINYGYAYSLDFYLM